MLDPNGHTIAIVRMKRRWAPGTSFFVASDMLWEPYNLARIMWQHTGSPYRIILPIAMHVMAKVVVFLNSWYVCNAGFGKI